MKAIYEQMPDNSNLRQKGLILAYTLEGFSSSW